MQVTIFHGMRLYGGSDHGQWDMARRRRGLWVWGWWSEMTQTMQSTAPREDGDEGGSVPVLGLILNSGRFMPVLAFSARWTEVGSACPEFMGKAFRLSGL